MTASSEECHSVGSERPTPATSPVLLEKERDVCQGTPSPTDVLTFSSVSSTDYLWSAAAQGKQKQKLHR